MATRKPLVVISGAIRELPVGDSLDGAGSGGVQVAKFVVVGPLAQQAGDLAPRWYPDRTITLSAVYFSLGTSGGVSAVIDIKKNGTSIFGGTKPTCTAGANKSSTVSVSTSVTPSDYLTASVLSAAGSDATVCITYQ